MDGGERFAEVWPLLTVTADVLFQKGDSKATKEDGLPPMAQLLATAEQPSDLGIDFCPFVCQT